MLKDDNISNVYYKFYICQLRASTPYSEFLPKVKAELKQLEEEVFSLKESSTPIIPNQTKTEDFGRNLNYLAQTINQYENIDFERNADDNYMKHIIVYENKFYSKDLFFNFLAFSGVISTFSPLRVTTMSRDIWDSVPSDLSLFLRMNREKRKRKNKFRMEILCRPQNFISVRPTIIIR